MKKMARRFRISKWWIDKKKAKANSNIKKTKIQ